MGSRHGLAHALASATPAVRWSPLLVPGLAVYYDSRTPTSLWQDSARTVRAGPGQPVGAWDDLSGAGRHLVQATSGRRPTLGGAGVAGDDVDDGLAYGTGFSPVGAFTLLLAGTITSAAGAAEYDQVIAWTNGTTWFSLMLSGAATYSTVGWARGAGAGAANGVRAASAGIGVGKFTALLRYLGGTATDPAQWSLEWGGAAQTLTTAASYSYTATGLAVLDRPSTIYPAGLTLDVVAVVGSALSGADLVAARGFLAGR